MKRLAAAVVFTGICLAAMSCQDILVPADFRVVLGHGANWPADAPQTYVALFADGRGEYRIGTLDSTIDSVSFSIPRKSVQAIYRSVMDNQFFALDKRYHNPHVLDGGYDDLFVEAEGTKHTVELDNTSNPRFERIARTIRNQLPHRVARKF